MKKIYTLTTAFAIFSMFNVNAQSERGNRDKGNTKDHVTKSEQQVNPVRPEPVKQPPVREPQIRQERPVIKDRSNRDNGGVRNNGGNRNEPAVRTPNNGNNQNGRNIDSRNNGNRNNNHENRTISSRQNEIARNSRYNRVDRNYYPDYRRPYSFYGQRYSNFYGSRYHIPYRGASFYFSSGFFYQPYNNYYQVIAAPIGIRIYGLPWGYRKWYIGPTLYYYYGGTYYRNINNYYEVVDAPLGSILPELPGSAKSVVINGQQYFENNGTYYKESLRNGETWYTVVGKNGSLTTTNDTINEVNTMVGDMVTDLPDNCKTVVLNNQKYYVSENDVYYQELIADNNLYYKVVAKP